MVRTAQEEDLQALAALRRARCGVTTADAAGWLRNVAGLDHILVVQQAGQPPAAMLGAMCISGDITCLSESQWQAVDAGLHFYRRVSEVIRRGTTYRYGTEAVYYDAPVGWQAVVRRGENGETLVVFHRFGGEAPAEIVVPVPSSSIVAVYDTCGSVITAADGQLRWHPPANFSAASVLLR